MKAVCTPNVLFSLQFTYSAYVHHVAGLWGTCIYTSVKHIVQLSAHT